jgi:predicted TIM-barrel fold metal-dependent hydrolase
MDSYGSDKVLFGTDWPVIDPRRAVAEVRAHNLRPPSFGKLMRDNALRVFPALAGRLASESRNSGKD